ncbi:hybrid sensor histidine kinase/response regulator [Chloroflexus sp.]|uniref:hybrid sensor histidine kinase/response regulator n=1 Tax=Chloroflexus sp. TaxID=1904827 RepID=UPI002628D6FF|nr:hybrid sensor histidine kinase/response regulator [uncultured Chloroflexus sp.]
MLSPDDIQSQVLAVFRAEQAEHRQAIADILLDLERQPDHPQRREMIDRLFRAAHSLKGGARAAGVATVEQLAHQVENIFAALRQNQLTLSPDICDVIYQSLDLIGELMNQAVPGNIADEAAFAAMLAQLSAIVQSPAPATTVPPTTPARAVSDSTTGAATTDMSVRVEVSVLDHLMHEAGELLTCTLRSRQLARDLHDLAPLTERWRRAWRKARPLLRTDSRRGSSRSVIDDQQALLTTLELANELIDTLQTKVAQLATRAREDHDRLAAISARLQAQIQQTRMAPLTEIIGPLRLHVRELARSAGKQVEFVIDDGGAEADRQVLDKVRMICLHLLRNAVDHGIELPAEREAAGKAPTGLIKLTARATADRLNLSVSDDGAGIDPARIWQQALASGIVSARDTDRADDHAALDLIFMPGFSTKTSVSSLSGRGVGLDVVRTTVERMGGQVTVTSTPGQGTTFNLSLPLTLQRSHGLLVKVAGHTFALPLDSMQRIVQARRDHIRALEGRTALLVEGRPLPLIALGQLLGLKTPTAIDLDTPSPAILLGVNERRVAFLVDAVSEELELVVHRLPLPLQRVRFVSGAAILADGSVAPILDSVDLLRAAMTSSQHLLPPDRPVEPRRTPTILVVDDSITTRTLEKNILESAGYHVVLATNGQEALERLRALRDQQGCQLVLSDVDMPRINGFELTERIRSDPHLRAIPVVLVTSLDNPTDRERGLAAGADAYIVKRAFDQQALLATIERLL